MGDRNKRPIDLIDLTGEDSDDEKRPRTVLVPVPVPVSDDDDIDNLLLGAALGATLGAAVSTRDAPPTVRPDGIVVSSSTQQLEMIAGVLGVDSAVCGAKHHCEYDFDDAGQHVSKKAKTFKALKTQIEERWVYLGYKWNDTKLEDAMKLMRRRATDSNGILKLTKLYATYLNARGLTFGFGGGAFQVHVRTFDDQVTFFLEFMIRVSNGIRLAVTQGFAQLLEQFAEQYPQPNVFFCFPTHSDLQRKFQVTPTCASTLFFNDGALDGVHTTAVLLKGSTIEIRLNFKLFGDEASLSARKKMIAHLTHYISAPLDLPFYRLVDQINAGVMWIPDKRMTIARLQRDVLNVPADGFDPAYFQVHQIRTSAPSGIVCPKQISSDLVANGALLSPDEELLGLTLGDVSMLSSMAYFRFNKRSANFTMSNNHHMGAFGMIIIPLDVYIIPYDNAGLM